MHNSEGFKVYRFNLELKSIRIKENQVLIIR